MGVEPRHFHKTGHMREDVSGGVTRCSGPAAEPS